MITKREKKNIIKVLGTNYSSGIQAHLKSEGITGRNNNTHTLGFIRKVMNGETGHSVIEDAIINYVEIEKEKIAIKKDKRAKILGTKKAVASTTA